MGAIQYLSSAADRKITDTLEKGDKASFMWLHQWFKDSIHLCPISLPPASPRRQEILIGLSIEGHIDPFCEQLGWNRETDFVWTERLHTVPWARLPSGGEWDVSLEWPSPSHHIQ